MSSHPQTVPSVYTHKYTYANTFLKFQKAHRNSWQKSKLSTRIWPIPKSQRTDNRRKEAEMEPKAADDGAKVAVTLSAAFAQKKQIRHF